VIIAAKATGVHFIVHLATPHGRGGKTRSNLYSLHCGKRHEGAHNGGVKLTKDRLAKTGRNAGSDHFNNSANRIPCFPGLFDFLAHGRYRVRVNAAQFIPLNLFCLSNLNQGPGDVQELQESPILGDGGPREPYATDPPTSGPRALQPAAFGFHASTIPDDVQVANLCAGHVIVHFNLSGGAALEAEMNRVARELEGYDVVVHPDAGLGDAEVVLTALLVMQRLDAYDKAEVYNFVRGYSGSRPTPDLCPGAGGG